MVTSKERKFQWITEPGSDAELEQMALNQLADRSFAVNRCVFNAAIQAIIAKLLVERFVRIPGFGYFMVGSIGDSRPNSCRLTVTFSPDPALIEKVEDTHVKFQRDNRTRR